MYLYLSPVRAVERLAQHTRHMMVFTVQKMLKIPGTPNLTRRHMNDGEGTYRVSSIISVCEVYSKLTPRKHAASTEERFTRFKLPTILGRSASIVVAAAEASSRWAECSIIQNSQYTRHVPTVVELKWKLVQSVNANPHDYTRKHIN